MGDPLKTTYTINHPHWMAPHASYEVAKFLNARGYDPTRVGVEGLSGHGYREILLDHNDQPILDENNRVQYTFQPWKDYRDWMFIREALMLNGSGYGVTSGLITENKDAN